MKSPFLRAALAAAACAAILASGGPAAAEVVKMKADLKAANEVPPNESKGNGSVDVTYDTGSKMLTWKGSYSGLSGPATAAHFHGPAGSGKNAGVMVPIFAGPAAKTPFEGTATLNDAQAQALMAGDMYVNVHTEANKAGEIRGQVTK